MTSKQIEIYLETAKGKSYTAISEKLYMSTATISRQMALLEEELGHQLFVHAGNSVKLTPEGEVLRDTLEKMNVILKHGLEIMNNIRSGFKGHLTLGFTSEMCIPDIFLKTMDAFRKKYPDVEIKYVANPYTEYANDMENGLIDITMAHDMALMKNKNLNHQTVLNVKRGLYYGVRNPLAKKKNLSVSDFADQIHWASKHSDTYDQRTSLRQIADYYKMPEFRTVYLNTTHEILFHLLLGEGFCIMDDIVLGAAPDGVLVLPIHDDLSVIAPVGVSVYWDKNNTNPCVPLFCDEILKHRR